MQGSANNSRLGRKLVDGLYVDAMLLADEARTYFDDIGRTQRDGLTPLARVAFSCESIKVTTRLMHVIAWLLTQRAVEAGELSPREALDPARRLGPAPQTEIEALAAMPVEAQGLVAASIELYRRVARLDNGAASDIPASPAREMYQRLELAF